ncbi:predicted protein [Histoplasma capsulatum var. duboisii H88]|uniref:Predicted protein n=2 Tax=Ajellomyces capsulatus TaxID=5037 RepID=F0U7N9_AJEC8|nr:predicted protein [Histoplasma capsulatum H143]EGC41608.1 predicted protein [Histoplasma capsulatum var. duboisii H88]
MISPQWFRTRYMDFDTLNNMRELDDDCCRKIRCKPVGKKDAWLLVSVFRGNLDSTSVIIPFFVITRTFGNPSLLLSRHGGTAILLLRPMLHLAEPDARSSS